MAQPQPGKGAVLRKVHFREKRDSWVRHHKYLAKDSFRQVFRRPLSSLLTWLVIAIALTLPSLMVMGLINLQQLTGPVSEGAQLSVYLNSSTDNDRAVQLTHELETRPEILTSRYVSPEKGLDEFRQFSGMGDILNSLPDNPLPGVIVIQPADQSAVMVEALKVMLEGLPEADSVQLDLLWVQRLNQIGEIVTRVIWVLGGILGLTVILVVGNTIRLAIESKRDEILVVKLVGATDAFIRRPFLYMGFWYGLFGGLLACLMVAGCYWYLNEPVSALFNSLSAGFAFRSIQLGGSLLVVSLSILISMLGTLFAVAKHIRAIEPT